MPTKPHTRWPVSICTAKVNAGRSGYASGGLGTEAHRRSCFTPPDAVGGIAARHIRQRARSMREKAKQEQRQLSKERQDGEKSTSRKSRANLLSMYDDDYARRAGEIIARAACAIHRRGTRR